MTSQQQSIKKEADVVFQQHNFRKAIELYTNAINVDPSSELAGTLFSNRSLCHHKLGNFEEALNDGITATTLKPKWARGHLRVATAYESLGKEDEAIEAFQKSLDLEENEEARKKYIALLRKNVDNMKKSQEELKLIGNGYVQKKKYEEAVIIYNASIDLDPSIESAAPIYSNRSLCFFNLGRFQEAEDDGCMAIFLRPEFARGYLRRGIAAMKLEKWKEASEAFEKYFELDPETAKSDPELVKNKKSVKKSFDRQQDEEQKKQELIEKTRKELMSIRNKTERKRAAKTLMHVELQSQQFDVDCARMLIECDADLAPSQLNAQQSALLQQMDPAANRDSSISLLLALLLRRGQLPSDTVPRFDELLFFVIEEMMRRDVAFIGTELFVACSSQSVGPLNSKLLRVLLETNKFEVNQSSIEGHPTPLMSLVVGIRRSVEMPHEVPECLHLLLNWKGIDVNAMSRPFGTDGPHALEVSALGLVHHVEVAKILIRYGANVNAVCSVGADRRSVLDHVITATCGSNVDEVIRFLIQSGARLLPNGRDGKSSSAIVRMLSGSVDREKKRKVFASEEVFQMILQLNQVQGLLFRWQDAATSGEVPFLFCAVQEGSPLRFVELLFATFPAGMKETGMDPFGDVVTIDLALSARIVRNRSSFEESIQVLGFLLERGLDLFESDAVTAFTNACLAAKQDVNLLKNTIIEKLGEKEFQRCSKTLKQESKKQ